MLSTWKGIQVERNDIKECLNGRFLFNQYSTPLFGIYLCIYHLSIYFLKYDSNLLMYIFWSKQNLRLDIHLNRKVLAVTESVNCIYLQWLFHTNYVILPEFTVRKVGHKTSHSRYPLPPHHWEEIVRKTYSCTWTYNFSKIFNKTYFIIIVLLDELCYEVNSRLTIIVSLRLNRWHWNRYMNRTECLFWHWNQQRNRTECLLENTFSILLE